MKIIIPIEVEDSELKATLELTNDGFANENFISVIVHHVVQGVAFDIAIADLARAVAVFEEIRKEQS